MALVEVIGLDVEAERVQESHAADAEHDLLLETVGFVAAVEAIGDRAVGGIVVIEPCVEQEDRDRMSDRAGQHVQPRPYPNGTPFDPNGHHGVERYRPIRQIPRIGVIDLPAVAIDLLAQITLPAGEGQEHHRQFEVGAGAGGVAGEHAEPAGIGVHLRPERDLHREIGDPPARKKGVDRRHLVAPMAGDGFLTRSTCRRRECC